MASHGARLRRVLVSIAGVGGVATVGFGLYGCRQHGLFWAGDVVPGSGPTYYGERLCIGAVVPRPKLVSPCDADVCIVGAGFAGLHLALELSERGRRVVVLEARRIGSGASGRNGGQALTGFAAPLCEAGISQSAASRLMASTVRALCDLESLIAKYNIDCAFTRCTGVAFDIDVTSSAVALDRDVHRQVPTKPGILDTNWHDSTAAAVGLGAAGVTRVVVQSPAAAVNPIELCYGLARATEQHGGVVHENTAVSSIRRVDGRFCVTTRDGVDVYCKQAVLCTNSAPAAISPALALATAHAYTSILVTEPLDKAALDSCVGSEDTAMYTDTRTIMSYFRRIDGDRLLFGALAQALPFASTEDMRRRLLAEVTTLFPQLTTHLSDARAVHSVWQGEIASRLPEFPLVGREPNTGYWFILGFGGHGIVPTKAAATAVSEALDFELRGVPVPESAEVRLWEAACRRRLGRLSESLPPSMPLFGAAGAPAASIALGAFKWIDSLYTGMPL